MVSTYLSYKMYTADMAKSVKRTLSDVTVAREQDYYKANIGKVSSVDDLLKDQRLYQYAMKAYGLEDMTYAKAFMRKVLESDLNDQNSFVRKLVDTRYITFARAFNFTTGGTVATGNVVAQDAADEAEMIGLYSEQRIRQGATVAADVDYYKARMNTITSVDQFVSDPKLFKFALEAYGIDASIASESAIKNVLLSDLSDPNSVANKYGTRYQQLAKAFSFAADGSVPAGAKAQTDAQLNATIYNSYEVTGNGSSPAAAAFKTDLFRNAVASVTSVDDLIGNKMLRDYALVAVGLDPIYTSDSTMRAVLTSDLSDPNSLANQLESPSFRTLAAAFNFNTDGSLDAGVPAQTDAQLESLTADYLDNYAKKALTTEQTATEYYKDNIASVSSVDELLGNQKLYNYVLKSFGIDSTQVSKATIKAVLQSDPTDPFSFAGRTRDSRFTALAAAFNFGSDGTAKGALSAQLSARTTETVTAYMAKQGDHELLQARAKTESEYFASTIASLENVDQLIADKRLVSYIKTAFGFEGETISDVTLKNILQSDVYDAASFVNTPPNTRFKDLAAAFNFGTDGKAKRTEIGVVQDRDVLAKTQDLFVRQTMEQRAGDQNQGVRLALYFSRKASSITTAYSILADKALLQVVMTSLNLPDSVGQADVDTQAKLIAKRINFDDFKDPKKLETFLARFTALYDMNNPQADQASSLTSQLFGGQSGGIIGNDLLTSIQSLKSRI